MNETIEIQDTECIGNQVKPWWRRTSGLISTLFDSGAIGTNGGKAEAVLHLTTSGKTFFSNPVIISAFATGVGQGVSMHQDGDFLVMSGPMNSFGSGN